MNSDSLLTKLFRVLLNHLLAAPFDNISVCLCRNIFLLHPKNAHFTLVKTLLHVFERADVLFKCAKILQILYTSSLYQFRASFMDRLIVPCKSRLPSCCFRLFSNLSEACVSPRISFVFSFLLLDRCVLRVLDIAFVGNPGDSAFNDFLVFFKLSLFSLNVFSVVGSSVLFELDRCFEVWYVGRDRMLWVCARDWQEIFCVNENTAFLHDSVWSLSTRLLNVPKELIFKPIFDRCISCCFFFCIKLSIAVFIEQLR